MGVRFEHKVSSAGIVVALDEKRFLQKGTKIPFETWSRYIGKPSDRRLRALVQGGQARVLDGDLDLPHATASSISSTLADTLGLPHVAAVSLALKFDKRIDSPDGIIDLKWSDANHRQLSEPREGAFLKVGGQWGRISESIYCLCEAVDRFNATQGGQLEQRIAAWVRVQEILKRSTGRDITFDSYMTSLNFYQAGCFALDVVETPNGPDFTPILMSAVKASSLEDDAPTDDVEDDGELGERARDLRDQVTDALLPRDLQRKFLEVGFAQPAETRDAYVLERSTYVVLTPDLKMALDVVRAKRSAPAAERRAFLRNPRAAISEAVHAEKRDRVSVFVETQQYSERVEGLGIWEDIKLPPTNRSGGWLPEQFPSAEQPRRHVTPDNLEEIEQKVREAEAEGRSEIIIDDNPVSVSEVRDDIDAIRKEQVETKSRANNNTDQATGDAPTERLGLVIKNNIDGVDYEIPLRPRIPLVREAFPRERMGANKPKEHQVTGFEWLVQAWTKGWPGVLLADDMGLGKTYQALAFLAWIKADLELRGRSYPTAPPLGPMLVVAPTALLQNWQNEAETHLAGAGLGEAVRAFGPGLRQLECTADKNTSADDSLDLDRLRDADWILTTYETLANRHRAFARIPYAVVVFDEVQKIKEPGSINTRSAKTVNADFVIALTGTPIENRIEDLWSIFDRIAPGYLGGLREFSKRYGGGDREALKALKASVDTPRDGLPALMLRRMKDKMRDGLPDKHVKTYLAVMPKGQAEAYRKIVEDARGSGGSRRSMLETIHRLRGVCLHPNRADDIDAGKRDSVAAWVQESARLNKAVEILKQIAARDEKAIIFVEDLAVQRAFAEAMATLFDLPHLPGIINGGVPGHRRQTIVDGFQKAAPGFDLLVLSPKAAGVGLNITAANHVLHLSRWWNPAVEDQCNDRAYRIGQTRDVTIHVPFAIHPDFGDQSFDVKLDTLLESKRALSRDVLCPPETENDLEDFFGTVIR
jgi:superfamily II DNA or RNA helicase